MSVTTIKRIKEIFMNNKDFNLAVASQVKTCLGMLTGKGKEYADNNSALDRLNHFKVAASLMEVDPKIALMGMFSKHIASVSKMCMSGKEYTVAQWNEKITDSINYLLILSAMIREGEENE